jgi:hypothetical protein
MIQLAKCVVAKSRVPSPKTLAISRTMVKVLSPIVNWSTMNQSRGHWLLGKALHFLILTCQELHEMLPH